MIVSCLRGGFGNQLFEYAFAKHIAQSLNTDLWLNDFFYRGSRIRRGYPDGNQNQKVDFELERFRVCYSGVCNGDWSEPSRILARHPDKRIVVDDSQTPEDVAALGDGLILQGWFQGNTRYLFERDFRTTLRSEITPQEHPVGDVYTRFAEEIEAAENPVAIQVRRGDYAFTPVFNLLGRDYYDRACSRIEAAVTAPRYFVFSDDVDRVRLEGVLSRQATFVETGDLVANFELARSCRHIVGANSTFSWWTAYCVKDDTGLVVMPSYNLMPTFSSKAAHDSGEIMGPPGWTYLPEDSPGQCRSS